MEERICIELYYTLDGLTRVDITLEGEEPYNPWPECDELTPKLVADIVGNATLSVLVFGRYAGRVSYPTQPGETLYVRVEVDIPLDGKPRWDITQVKEC